MRRMIIILSILLGIGLTAEAQSVRSTTRRGYSGKAYGGYAGVHQRHYPRHGARGYWGASGVWVGGSVHFRGGGYVSGVWHSGSGYWNPYPRVRVGYGTYPVHPGYVYRHYGPRVVYVNPVPIEQVVPVEAPAPCRDDKIEVRYGDEVVATLLPGQAVITPEGVILENKDGELVVHRGEQ